MPIEPDLRACRLPQPRQRRQMVALAPPGDHVACLS